MMQSRRWLIGMAALAAFAATLSLGFWQWGRAQEKLALHAAIEQRGQLPALDERAVQAASELQQLHHRPVVLRGEWAADHTIFLENRQMQGRVGFYVVTPLRIAGGAAVLVQRGWAPRDFNQRDRLPPVQTPTGPVVVRGRLAPPPAKLYEFDAAAQGPIRQNLDLARFRAETRLALLDLSVQQAGAASEGLLREWPEVASGAGKNWGYAFQWWALSGLIAVLYVWFQFIVPRRKRA